MNHNENGRFPNHQTNSHPFRDEVTFANAISVIVRPALAYSATKVDMERKPLLYAGLWVGAILSDGIDGLVARHLENGGSKHGDKFDLLGDRAVEQIGLRDLARRGVLPIAVANLFLARTFATDGLRFLHQIFNDDSEQINVLHIRDESSTIRPESRLDRVAYAAEKAAIGAAAPYSVGLAQIITGLATIHSLRRAKPVIMNPKNAELVKKIGNSITSRMHRHR